MMLPREHGAYGQLLLPLMTALAIGRPSAATVAIAGCAGAAFIAHEPALVLLGRRGERLRRTARWQAVIWLLVFSGVAAVLAIVSFSLLPPAARWALVPPAALASLAAGIAIAGGERTAVGEIVVSAALASVSLPVAIASGVPFAVALTCAASFLAAFIAATVSVRAVIAGARGGSPRARAVALGTAACLLGVVSVLGWRRVLLPAAVWAASPVCLVAVTLALVVPRPRYLRTIGWTLVGATALTGVILVVAIR